MCTGCFGKLMCRGSQALRPHPMKMARFTEEQKICFLKIWREDAVNCCPSFLVQIGNSKPPGGHTGGEGMGLLATQQQDLRP